MANRRSVLKLVALLFLAQYLIQTALAQTPQRLRSTFSIGGSSKTFTAKGKHYIVQQSIGQSSVIDSYRADGFVLRQGFIQPLMSVAGSQIAQPIQADISPNPSTGNIAVSFTETISENLIVTLYDMLGRPVFTNSYEPVQVLNLDLGSFASGLYILTINSGNKHLVTKLTKV